MLRNLLIIFLTCLIGCTSAPDDMGIVARVNGQPIYLSQLEFQHDQFQADTAGAYVPSVDKLRKEYGAILADLIVQELVVQELAKRDLEVTDHEMLKAEEAVRADYPDDAFEQMLVEEYIDLKSWRMQLKYHLAMKKFYHQVLRPQIKIDYKEAEKYYREHISDFYLPENLRILVVRGPSRELVEKAVAKYKLDQNQMNLATAFGEVETREVVVREGRLSAAWRNAVQGLEVGQSSGILTDRFGFEALVLLEKSTAKVLEPAQAYPLVEEALLESKLRDAFDEWLDKTLATAAVSVSEHLLPGDSVEGEPGEEEVMPPAENVEPSEAMEPVPPMAPDESFEAGEAVEAPEVVPPEALDAEDGEESVEAVPPPNRTN